uniref:LITAF domain-containing protein n=1 Tax=Steinernema glaseri TaxID=37863 RepID=A0A1I8AT45_9BILA
MEAATDALDVMDSITRAIRPTVTIPTTVAPIVIPRMGMKPTITTTATPDTTARSDYINWCPLCKET